MGAPIGRRDPQPRVDAEDTDGERLDEGVLIASLGRPGRFSAIGTFPHGADDRDRVLPGRASGGGGDPRDRFAAPDGDDRDDRQGDHRSRRDEPGLHAPSIAQVRRAMFEVSLGPAGGPARRVGRRR